MLASAFASAFVTIIKDMMHVPEYGILADILHAWCVAACCCVIWICVLCEHLLVYHHATWVTQWLASWRARHVVQDVVP